MEENLNFDKVWAMFQETREQMKETDRKWQEYCAQAEKDRMQAEKDRMQAEKDRAQAEKESRERAERAEKDREQMRVEMKELSRHLGGIGNSNGAYAENYFYNSLNKTKMFGHEHFDYADFNVKPLPINNIQDEYDIVLLNGKSVAIVEVKYRAKKEHIAQTINKAATFRQFFPTYKDFTFYLGLAGFSFEEEVEQDALNAGLAVLKQVGENVVVQDERIKKF